MAASSGAAVQAFTTAVSFKFKRDATKRRALARRMRARIVRLKNRQAKRAFLRNFRQQQADTLVAGVASGAGIESSGVRGQLASGRAQLRTAAFEFGKQEDLSAEANRLDQRADRADQIAGSLDAIGEVAGSFG